MCGRVKIVGEAAGIFVKLAGLFVDRRVFLVEKFDAWGVWFGYSLIASRDFRKRSVVLGLEDHTAN